MGNARALNSVYRVLSRLCEAIDGSHRYGSGSMRPLLMASGTENCIQEALYPCNIPRHDV
eukprot:scaffold632762_cov15-Prasinocladus_malaysianus.AAC.1